MRTAPAKTGRRRVRLLGYDERVAADLTLLTRVTYRGRPVASPRVRQLLAALSADLRTGASSARLIDVLWPDDQPSHPAKALQVLVSRARSALGSDLIVSTPTGYRLGLAPEQVDAHRAALDAAACERAAREHDCDAALSHAESGLALWDAPSDSADGADDPLGELRAEHEAVRVSLTRGRALALAALGRHEEALPILTELAESNPLDEPLLVAVLRCEAVTTGAPAALERYETHRRRLRDSLGSDPGPALQQVQRELLDGQVPRQVRGGIPYQPNSLVGRDDDLAAVLAMIARSRVTSIVGPGGLGKTRLAHMVSHRVDQPRVQFVPLAGVSSPDGVAAEVASALGVRDPRMRHDVQIGAPPRDIHATIIDALSPGPSLLVLDNCEHVIAAAADLVRALIELSPDLHVLTTSRAPLGVSSESVYLLPELDLTQSVDLFTQRARAARPDVDLPTDAVQRLCSHLDGLPLALELAAARVRVMSVPQIADRLTDRFALLRGSARDAPARHRTLQAVIDWSWDLLDAEQQSTLVTLSVFPDGFTLDAAEAVLADDTRDPIDPLDALVEQSLLKVEDRPTGIRYRMLETVREFGTAHLERAGRIDDTRARFQRWATDLATASIEPLFGPDLVPVLDRLTDEQDNLVTALRNAIEDGDGWTTAATFGALASMWAVRSNHTRTHAYSADVAYLLSHFSPSGDQVEVVRSALTFCMTDVLSGRRSGIRAMNALRSLPDAVPDNPIRAMSVLIPLIGRHLEAPVPVLEPLLSSPHRAMVAATAMLQAHLLENDGYLREALEVTESGFRAVSRERDPWLHAMYLARLAEIHLQLGEHVEGERRLRSALPLLEAMRMNPDVQATHRSLALTAISRGDTETAAAELELAERVFDDAGFIPGTFDEMRTRAEFELSTGRVTEGLRRWRHAVERTRREGGDWPVNDPPGLEPWTVMTEGQALAAHARFDRLDLVPTLASSLSDKLHEMAEPLDSARSHRALFIVDMPVCGSALLGIGLAALRGDGAAQSIGASIVAVADTMAYPRYQPCVPYSWIREFTWETTGSAYDTATASYADLDPGERLPEALRLLDKLPQSSRR